MSATAHAQALSLPTVARHRPVWAHFIFLSVDILTLQLCLFLGVAIRSALLSFYPVALHQQQYVGLMLGVLVVPVIYYVSGLYPGDGLTAPERLRNRICGTVAVFLALLYWNNAFQDRVWSRGILIVTFALALLLLPLSESLTRQLLARSAWWRRPVAILGAGARVQQSHTLSLLSRPLGLNRSSSWTMTRTRWGKRIGEVPVYGPLERVNHLRASVDTVIIAIPEMPGGRLASFVQRLQFSSVIIFPGFDGLQSQWVKSRDFGGMLGLEMKKNLLLPFESHPEAIHRLSVGYSHFPAQCSSHSCLCVVDQVGEPGSRFLSAGAGGQTGHDIQSLEIADHAPACGNAVA